MGRGEGAEVGGKVGAEDGVIEGWPGGEREGRGVGGTGDKEGRREKRVRGKKEKGKRGVGGREEWGERKQTEGEGVKGRGTG